MLLPSRCARKSPEPPKSCKKATGSLTLTNEYVRGGKLTDFTNSSPGGPISLFFVLCSVSCSHVSVKAMTTCERFVVTTSIGFRQFTLCWGNRCRKSSYRQRETTLITDDVSRFHALRSSFNRRTAFGISDTRVFPKPKTNPWRGASPTYDSDKAESHSFLAAAFAAISLSSIPPLLNSVRCMPASPPTIVQVEPNSRLISLTSTRRRSP